MTSDPPFAVHISSEAAERLRRRGSRLFLWNDPAGRMGLHDRLAYSPPSGREFSCYHSRKRGIQICVPPDFAYREVIVRAQRWPLRGIRVYVNGRRWGWRGELSIIGNGGSVGVSERPTDNGGSAG